jgi:hypothetical protein
MPSVRSNGQAEWRAARNNGRDQAAAVASGYGFENVQIAFEVDPSFEPGAWVRADAEVSVEAIHLPFMRRFFGEGAPRPTVTLHSRHWERIDRYRSRLP